MNASNSGFALGTIFGKKIIPTVDHPKKKTQEELWKEMFPDDPPLLSIT